MEKNYNLMTTSVYTVLKLGKYVKFTLLQHTPCCTLSYICATIMINHQAQYGNFYRTEFFMAVNQC